MTTYSCIVTNQHQDLEFKKSFSQNGYFLILFKQHSITARSISYLNKNKFHIYEQRATPSICFYRKKIGVANIFIHKELSFLKRRASVL